MNTNKRVGPRSATDFFVGPALVETVDGLTAKFGAVREVLPAAEGDHITVVYERAQVAVFGRDSWQELAP